MAKRPTCEFPLTATVLCTGYPAKRNGPGMPLLCNVHQRQVDVQGAPATRGARVARAAAASAAGAFDFGKFFAGVMAGLVEPTPGPPPAAGGMSPTIARLVMRFDVGEVLTREKVSARRRELARKYHPDHQGGDSAAMQELNAAAEVLLKDVGG